MTDYIKTSQALLSNVGVYREKAEKPQFVDRIFSAELSKGVDKYCDGYRKKHADFMKKYAVFYDTLQSKYTLDASNTAYKKYRFFREAFVKFLAEFDANVKMPCPVDEPTKNKIPQKGTISLERLIGSEGAALYRLALEEERYSRTYLNEVLSQSTTAYKMDECWTERPVIFIGGPSGCGKSTAVEPVVKKTLELLQKETEKAGTNYTITIDNSLPRKISQMRKIIIQVANNQGYTGISDLHKQSNDILRPVKKRLEQAALGNSNLGVVIPTTFSDYRPLKGSSELKNAIKLPLTRTIFCCVEGARRNWFQLIVSILGSKRAWKTNDFTKKPLDLNATDLTESKEYEARGFKPGVYRSEQAKLWFKKHAKENLMIRIVNDLIYKKPILLTAAPGTTWLDAKKGDVGAILVSSRFYDEWIELTPEQQTAESLAVYNDRRFKEAGPLIYSSAEFDLAVIRETFRKTKDVLSRQINQWKHKHPGALAPAAKTTKLETITDALDAISTDNLKIANIRRITAAISRARGDYKGSGFFGIRFSGTHKLLGDIVAALAKFSSERVYSKIERDLEVPELEEVHSETTSMNAP